MPYSTSQSYSSSQATDSSPFSEVTEPLTLKEFFEGLAQLVTSGVIETTEVVEAMHRELLLRPLGRFNDIHKEKWSKGMTGKTYRALRGFTKKVGYHLALPIASYYPNHENHTPLSPTLKQLVNIINGVIGDYLVENDNSLAVTMRLYDRYGQPQKLSAAQSPSTTNAISGRVVILVHGLCMSYLGWRICEPDGLGERIVQASPQTTILYLDYNSGQSIPNNGRDLSALLNILVKAHPDISQIDLVGHSMGGLIIRSAIFYANTYNKKDSSNKINLEKIGLGSIEPNRINRDWVNKVNKVITLGTPHNGAILERIGYFIQDISAKIPYASTLSTLVNIRSKGINDLRYGSICNDAFVNENNKLSNFPHTSIALPDHITLYCIAGTVVGGLHDSKVSHLIGDGLVVIDSAFGDYIEEQALKVAEHHKAVFYGISHYNLIYHASIHQQVIVWLNENSDDDIESESKKQPSTRLHIYQNNLKVEI